MANLIDTEPVNEQPARRRRQSIPAIILGLIGELLITVGLFVGLFVVWQLWWTDVEVASDKRDALAELDEGLPPIGLDQPVEQVDMIEDDEKLQDGAPDLPRVAPGELLGSLWIPSWDDANERIPVASGTDLPTVLNLGRAGHYFDHGAPGQVGNFALAGHRTTYGRVFHWAADLTGGDYLIYESKDGWYVYHVVDSKVVLPNAVEVIAPVPGDLNAVPTEKYLTLTTCHPMFSAEERYIVHAIFDYWAPREAGIPKELLEN